MEKGGFDEESGRRCSSRMWYRVFAAVFALITALLVVVAIALILTQKPVDLGLGKDELEVDNVTAGISKPQQYRRRRLNYRRFTFDQLFSGKLFLKDMYDYSWASDGSLLRKKDEFGGFLAPSGVTKTAPNSFDPTDYLNASEYMKTLSANRAYASRCSTVRQLFRYSTERVCEIARVVNGTVSEATWPVGPNSNSSVQEFSWNPSEGSNDFIFVHDYNIYYQPKPEDPSSVVQLTTDGEYYYRYGTANWLYEEEIFDTSSTIWWSPSGRYVSYLRLDDKNVNKIFIPSYETGEQYVMYNLIPYPKAGVVENSKVAQFIWDRQKNKVVEAVAPEEIRADNQTFYVLANEWIRLGPHLRDLGPERLITVWSNREQNRVYYTLCNEIDCLLTYTQSFSMHGKNMWAEPREVGCVVPTAMGFFTILPHTYADGNVYNHIAHIGIESTGIGKITQWIGEDYDVLKIAGYWLEKDILTYTAYGKGVGFNNLYRVPKATNQKIKDQTTAVNLLLPNCEHGSYSVDPTGKRAALLCHQPFENTRFYLMDVEKPKSNRIIDGSEEAFLPFDKLNITFGIAKLASGIEVQYSLTLPPRINPNEKYPLIVDVYGGPNSKKVLRQTPSAHLIQICSQYGIPFANFDVSGTAGRGWNHKSPVYKKLGQTESSDTLEAIRFLLEKYPFLDESNVAVMGWSYGGYLSTQVAIKDQGETVKCAVAIAPVTDFMYYDTAYTERYMGFPLENPAGYNETNLIPNARKIANVKYFLAHGEADDNVHYQNSARWSEALQYENIHFTQLVYANEAHGLHRKIVHLYSEVQRFLIDECFESPTLQVVEE